MTRIKNSLGDRVLALFLSFVMLFGLIPFNMISVYAAGPDYGTLSGITTGGTVTNADSSDATITYSSGAVLDWSAKDPSIGRTMDGWWIGVKMTAPDGKTTQADFDGVTLKSKGSSNTWSDPIDFWACKDSDDGAAEHFVGLWGVVNEERLNDALTSGTTIQYQWQFDWNADGIYEQLATLIIDPNNIVLKKDEATVYPTGAGLGTVTAYTEGVTVSNGTGNFAGADFTSSATLSWFAADPSIGRTSDGWWVGLKMTAPDALTTESDFDGVTLKAKGSSNEWSDAMSFWACKDSSNDAASHFVGLWGLVTDAYLENAVANGRNVEYSWKFDWDKDGVYEQQVNLSIDPSKLTLIDSEDNQVYPSLGTVTPYTGGTVSGVTGNITVTVDNTTLNWSPKDPSIGRTIDAWWVGVKVTAPDYPSSVLQNSKLKYKSISTGEWSDIISFWDAKDSADGDASQFVGIWMPLTPAKLAEAEEAGNNIVSEYEFDWNNDGVFEQLITVVVVPGDGIVLNKVDQTGFAFVNEAPVDQWAGSTFTNTASGGQSTGAVTYSIVSGDSIASVDENTGTVTFSAAGTITVRATKAGDDTYNAATAEYTVTSVRYPQTEFKFATTNPGAIAYADGKTFENEASGGSGTGAITYAIISGGSYAEIDPNTGVVTLLKAGDITVKATKAADAFYEETTATYTLKINLGMQTPLAFETLPTNNELVYKTTPYEDAITVSGGSGSGALTFSIVDGTENATITTDGKITTLQEGSFKVRVEKTGDDGYEAAAPIEVTLNVIKAEQTTFAFTYPTPNSVTYNENGNTFENPAINGESTGAVSYEIVTAGGDSIVDVAADGTLTIKRAGEVTIRATKAADNKYNAAQVQYTIVIEKANQTFSFADGTEVSKYYGIKNYLNEIVYTAITTKPDGKGYGTGLVTYELSGADINATVAADGTVTFADSDLKVGTITIKAKKAADECYNEVEKEYTLTVSYLPTPASPFSLSGETRNESGWYTGDVTITAATGYNISYSNNLSTDDWAESVVYETLGTHSTNVYLINADGSITDAIPVENLQIDKTDPINVDITYSTSVLDKIFETVTFGIYKAPVTVTLTAKNVYSGIESFTYNYNGEDITVNKSDFTSIEAGVATYSFTIDPQYRGVVTMTATSTSGRSVNYSGTKTLVVDSLKPELSVTYDYTTGEHYEDEGVYYTEGKTTVYFAVEESNFDLSGTPVVKVNNHAMALVWTQNTETGKWETSIPFEDPGNYKINVTYQDIATNEMDEYNQTLVLDDDAPVLISYAYDNNSARNDNYFKADRKATILISEDYFKAERIQFVVSVTDITGANIKLTGTDTDLADYYLAFLQDKTNWTKMSGNTYKAEVDFTQDGIYDIALNYTDLSGNAMTEKTDNFVIDKNISSDVTIEYSTSIIDKVLETITFGLYQGDVIVTVSAKDQTAGVEYFQITYTAVDGQNTSNKATYTTEQLAAVQDDTDKTLFTATHTITKEARGKVFVNLIDKAGNATDKAEEYVVVADTIAPGLAYEWTFTDDQVREYNNIYYTQGETKVKFTITEANFDLSLKKADDEDAAPAPVLTVNGVAQNVTWTQTDGTDEWVTEITLTENGDYVVGLTYTDRSTNAMDSYTKEVHIDNVAPAFEVTYDNNEARNENNYKADRTATIKITEHNFKAEEVNLVVTAKDITGADVDISSKAYSDYAKVPTNWTQSGDVWTLNTEGMKFDIDAIYHVELNYTDLTENDADTYTADFVIDKNISSDVTIEYSTSIIDKVLETITFGLYQGDVTVTVTAMDQTAGVEYFQITYTAVDGQNTSNKATYTTEQLAAVQDDTDKTLFTATHTITKEARGKVSVNLIDKAGNATDKAEEYVVVADTIAPGLAYEWTFTDDQVREYNNIYYTQGETKVKFTITEANFDLSLKKADDEDAAHAPVLTVNGVAQNVTWTQTDGTDEWVTEITLTGNGDYVVGLTYTDRSTNAMDSYTKEVHIDNVAPVFDVTYDNNEARNENNYKADRTATIKITEHNFKAEEVNLVVTAKDITGADVDISSKAYSDYAKVPANWTQSGDVWTLKTDGMKFDIDAIYHVELNYKNLAEKDAETYTADFVIDKNISSDVTIEYSTSIIDKVLETITFGLYQGDVIVTVSAKDQTAGVEYFQITYTAVDGQNTSNKATYTTEQLAAVQDDTDKTLFTATHTITKEARGKVSVNLIDKAGNATDKAEEYVVVADTIAPGLAYEWTFTDDQVREYNNIYYTKGETKVKFTITEANFDLSLKKADDEDAAPAPVLTVNGVAQNVTWTQTDGTDEWVTEITLTENGDYVVGLTYTDRSTNAMDSYTKEVHIDNVAPAFEVTYDNNEARNENNYKADRTATIKITEHNFKAEEVNLVVTAKDITGADVDISSKAYSDYAKVPTNWTQNGDVWTLVLPKFDIDAIYHIELNYTDLAENDADTYTADFVIDKTSPSNVKVEYSESILDKVLEAITFGFYQPRVIVTVTAQDDTAGVEYFKITYTKQEGTSAVNTDTYTTEELVATQKADAKNIFTAEHTIPANARGTVSVELLDKAGNGSNGSNATVAVVDNIAPTREVIYTPERVLDATTLLDVDSYQEGDNSILYYKNEAVVTFKITEANFDLSLKDENTKPVIKVNNNPVNVEWSNAGDVWTAVYTIAGDGDYVVTMTYVDLSTNAMVDYTSATIAIDKTVPTISVAYDPADAVANGKFFNTDRSMTVTIVEHNFRAEDIVVNVTAKDANATAIANEADVAKTISDYLKNRSNWTTTSDTHVATVPFTVDAQYNVTIDYSDLIGNAAAQYVAPAFVIDHVAPSNLTISYSQEIKVWEKVLNAVTFGYYSYNPSVEVTMTAFDDISGVDFFTWTYTQEEGTSTTKNVSTRTVKIPTSEITYSADNKTATAKFTLTGTDAEQFRGTISFTATDRAANESTKYDDNTRINIVDTISPTRTVTYSDAKQVVDASTLKTRDTYEYSGEDTNSILYYDDDVTVTVKVNEANFYAEDVVIKDNSTKVEPNNWTQNGDEWTATFKLTSEGDHIVTMTYTDRSNNVMSEYKSQRIIIDRTAPVIDVQYSNSEVKNTVKDSENHDRKYFDKDQTATITITEHNFRPDDVIINVKAKDVVGSNIATFSFDADGNVTKYAGEGKSRDEWAKLSPFTDSATWRRNGDTFKLVIDYTNDANYTFDIEYKDLAGNAATARPSDYFTVDKTAPKNLTVSYSTNVFENVLESITFGYYNAQMTVTITAEDDTSGIYHFLYSYAKSEGVSGVNAELIDDAIQDANISYNGAVATATFTIPKYVLANDNQFNGTVRFTAYDRSENSTDKADTERIIVDNIKPTVTVTYNDSVRNTNNISYYAGDANVRIDIREANFYSEDVKISVTKDGNNYPVTVNWANNSVDDHSGTFTLTEDGDYIVSVTYSDRSGNAMENYQSNRITVDKTKPTISVSTIKNNTANKDDVYTFTITANDTNIDFETFKPELKALVKNESGNYTVKSIPLGDIKTVEAGKTYSFTVQNLEEDAAYTLTCVVKDMSGNEFSSIKLDDGNEYENVRFSINRDGSTFAANEFTTDLVEQYYVYSVEKDVVLEEINVDPIENFVVKLNGAVLEEGKDYTTTITNNDGEWSKRTYTIHKDLFEAEGEYSIVIESTDKADTKAYSDVKNLKIAFVVDQTEPVLVVSGVEDGGRYQIDEEPVTVIPSDEGGRLFSFKAIVLDSSGNPLMKDGKDISVRFDMSGEEFLTYLEEHDGKITFTIPEGLENQLQLVCNDCAVKADGTTNEYTYTYTKVTVSQSGWVIFYANKPLFYGSIGGVVGLAGIATGLTVFLKKRKAGKVSK